MSVQSIAVLTSILLAACGPTVETSANSDGGSGSVGAGGEGGAMSGSSSGTGMQPSVDAQTLTQIDLGDIGVNVFNGFEVPENALGLTAIAQSPKLEDIIGISRIRAPSNDYVIFDYSVASKANSVFVEQGWVAGASVQSDLPQAWPVQSGLWRILIGSDGTAMSANVRVWVRHTSDGAFHGGVVDVNVFVVPNASTTNYITTVLDELFKDYAGLKLGNVNFLSLDSAFGTISTRDQYRALLATSAGVGAAPALNMFVIGKFGTDFGGAIGVAGGIPGSATVHGTTISGVAYQPSGNPAYDATVLRHEIGHLAGLFHTTEFATETQQTDPLSDTVECSQTTIQSNPDACPDVTNTMFPIAYGSTELTTGQARVLQGSALYRGVFSAGADPDPSSNAIAPQQQLHADPSSVIVRLDKPMPAHPSALERVLGGVWCSHGHADYEALAVRVAGDASEPLLRSLVLDENRPDILRARALGALLRASSGVERARALDLAEDFARRDVNTTDLRTAALESLSRFDPARARSVSVVLSRATNPVLRDAAQRILGK